MILLAYILFMLAVFIIGIAMIIGKEQEDYIRHNILEDSDGNSDN